MAYKRKGYAATYVTPSRRSSTNTYKRARRTPKSSRRTRFTIQPSAIADSVSVKLLYYTQHNVNQLTVVDGPQHYVYSLNDPRDPYWHLGGAQPTGFDQWMSMYTRYRVSACTMNVQYTNGTGLDSPCVLSLVPNPVRNTALDGRDNNGDLTYGKQVVVGHKGHSDTKSLTTRMTMTKLVGKKWRYDDDYYGTATSSPSTSGLATWNIGLTQWETTAGSTIGSSVKGWLNIKMIYEVIFEGRRVVTDS